MPVSKTPPLAVIWAGLVLATALSLWLGAEGATAATALAIVVAFVKVRFVGLHFMELRDAPPWLRLAFEAWVALVCLVLTTTYLLS